MTDASGAALRRVAMLCLLCAVAVVAPDRADGDQEQRAVELQERTERHLVQVDVSLDGPADVVAALTPADFSLKVMTRVLEDFTVDRVCRRTAEEIASLTPRTDTPSRQSIRESIVPTQVTPTTYLFYFDHTSMSLEGNNRAPQVARELIPLLVRNGNRGMVVSNGRVVTTHVDLTEDVNALVAGVDALIADFTTWWEPTQRDEDMMIAELVEALATEPRERAARLAKDLAVDEQFYTEKAYRRLTMVLGRLADLPQPKAAVLFTDRMRRRPGLSSSPWRVLLSRMRPGTSACPWYREDGSAKTQRGG